MQTLINSVFVLMFLMIGLFLVGMFLVGIDWFLFDGKILPKVKAKIQKVCGV